MTFLPDGLGNLIALTDNTGAIQTQYSYGPFGNVTITGAASNNPYQFAGMQNTGAGGISSIVGILQPCVWAWHWGRHGSRSRQFRQSLGPEQRECDADAERLVR